MSFLEKKITGDIKEVKGGAYWKREIRCALFVLNMVKVVLKYQSHHFWEILGMVA